jgi:tetratricopeptide (TPR) repeat protein
MSREKDLKRQIARHNRRLQMLKEKEAVYGLETPVSILTEIADIENEVKELSAELESFKQAGGEEGADFSEDSEGSSGKKYSTLVWVIVVGVVLVGSVLAVVVAIATGMFILYPDSASESLAGFTVDRPVDNAELPLDDSQNWIIEGKFPKDLEAKARINVEVFKLPERESIAQTGKLRLSTVQGFWSFAPVDFADVGEYEIVVSVYAGGEQDYRLINVRFLEKATVYKNSIQKERARRGAPPLVVAKPEEVSLDQLKEDLYHTQQQFFELYPQDLDGAQENISKIFDMLDPVLPVFPDDFYLQNVRAYNFKNNALVMNQLNQTEDFETALNEAERMFEAIRQQDPEDASAWNGLGSIALLRRDPEKALYYINRALELEPDYLEAIHDRDVALEMLESQ